MTLIIVMLIYFLSSISQKNVLRCSAMCVCVRRIDKNNDKNSILIEKNVSCYRIWRKIRAQMMLQRYYEKYLADAKKFVWTFFFRRCVGEKFECHQYSRKFFAVVFLYDCHSMCSQHAIHYYSLFSTNKET